METTKYNTRLDDFDPKQLTKINRENLEYILEEATSLKNMTTGDFVLNDIQEVFTTNDGKKIKATYYSPLAKEIEGTGTKVKLEFLDGIFIGENFESIFKASRERSKIYYDLKKEIYEILTQKSEEETQLTE